MRFSSPLALFLLAGAPSHALPAPQEEPSTPSPITFTAASTDTTVAADQLDQLSNFAQSQVTASLSDSSKTKRGGCNLSNVAVRREWGALSKKERKSYTDAVLCLQKKQARRQHLFFPTLTIHFTGTFLAWHRYYTWQYEQALRNECGYQGYQPYWDWAKTAATGLENSPILDGSEYSLSGNGEFIPGRGNVTVGGNGLDVVSFSAGSGGGCVTSGPFKDMKVNLGPISLVLTNGSTIANGDGLSYNPRCLKRDLTNYVNRRWANASSVAHLILANDNIHDFQMEMQGPPGSGELGVHGGGHYSMGGDPGRDFYVSPGDPLFYFHHAMIDRTWWIWQQLDKKTRFGASGISGTNTFLNSPPSANTTLDTPIDLGYAGSSVVTMNDLMSTTEGPFCYVYL